MEKRNAPRAVRGEASSCGSQNRRTVFFSSRYKTEVRLYQLNRLAHPAQRRPDRRRRPVSLNAAVTEKRSSLRSLQRRARTRFSRRPRAHRQLSLKSVLRRQRATGEHLKYVGTH
ncbi:hypothetical protein AOLI_G00000080 [Acnodon oligacanthus]